MGKPRELKIVVAWEIVVNHRVGNNETMRFVYKYGPNTSWSGVTNSTMMISNRIKILYLIYRALRYLCVP